MANQLRDHVLFIDTAAAGNVNANSGVSGSASVAITEQLVVNTIRFIPSAIGDTAVLKNGDGLQLWEASANAVARQTIAQESLVDLRFRGGVQCTTLGGTSKLYLYLKISNSAN